jgi:hypothetical protein
MKWGREVISNNNKNDSHAHYKFAYLASHVRSSVAIQPILSRCCQLVITQDDRT